uniref:Peptidase S1 domain-containing protein n=1 Tax=Timema cristinae TaxID=61476 RepID=A0A7R9CCX8_TIMCR|nr:unnamed protein product [Timema cristinae]
MQKWPTRPPESLIESGDDPFTRNISEPTTTERFILTSAKPSTIYNEEGCGKPIIPNHLIRNGVETERGDWPWLAALYTINTLGGIDFWCSGTLINNKHIVTALSNARLKPILWDGGREGERCGVASQPTKVYFRANKNRWNTETVDGASYQSRKYQLARHQLLLGGGEKRCESLPATMPSGHLQCSRSKATHPLCGSAWRESYRM